MNTIVRRHYPASKLPADLREGIEPGTEVTVTIVAEEVPPRRVRSIEEIFAGRRPPFLTAEDIDADLREGRMDRDD